MQVNPITTLTENLASLSAKDQEFAHSLLSARFPSEKQMYWIGKLAARATSPAPAAVPTTQVGNFAGVIALFNTGHANLKFPKIRLQLDDGRKVVLSLAGPAAKQPGTVNVTDGGAYGSNVWYGRVDANGAWQVSGKVDAATQAKLATLLTALAADPATVAAAYGRMTGSCCFCALTLTDQRSVSVGYGPVCAGNYGLPWGARAASTLSCEGVAAAPTQAELQAAIVDALANPTPMEREAAAMLYARALAKGGE
jgi:hypothetical protein